MEDRHKIGHFSRSKGKRGEREWVNWLKAHGVTARRTAQVCGSSGEAADVVRAVMGEEAGLEIKTAGSVDKAVATDETVKSTLSDNMADEPNEVFTTIDNEPDAAPEEAPQGVNTETGEVKK